LPAVSYCSALPSVQKCRSENRIRQHTEEEEEEEEEEEPEYKRITEYQRCKLQTTVKNSVSRRS
jgi:hypothetical protein